MNTPPFTAEQVGAITRTLVQLVAGLALMWGILDANMWVVIGSSLSSLASGAWSYYWIRRASTSNVVVSTIIVKSDAATATK